MYEVEEEVLSKVSVGFSTPNGIVVVCEFRDVVSEFVGHVEREKKILRKFSMTGRRHARYESGLITCRRDESGTVRLGT